MSHTTLTVRTYNIPHGLNAVVCGQRTLQLPAGHYSTGNWEEKQLLDNYAGVTFVSDTPLDLPDWSPYPPGEAAVPVGRTREYLIDPGPTGAGIDLMYYCGMGWGTQHLKRGPGLFVTSDRQVQIALYNYPGVTKTRDWAT
jgi:hypothetical protein